MAGLAAVSGCPAGEGGRARGRGEGVGVSGWRGSASAGFFAGVPRGSQVDSRPLTF